MFKLQLLFLKRLCPVLIEYFRDFIRGLFKIILEPISVFKQDSSERDVQDGQWLVERR